MKGAGKWHQAPLLQDLLRKVTADEELLGLRVLGLVLIGRWRNWPDASAQTGMYHETLDYLGRRCEEPVCWCRGEHPPTGKRSQP